MYTLISSKEADKVQHSHYLQLFMLNTRYLYIFIYNHIYSDPRADTLGTNHKTPQVLQHCSAGQVTMPKLLHLATLPQVTDST